MKTFVAWRILTHEKGRSLLAVGGIFIAVLMIFLQLGFYYCTPKSGLLTYNHLRFDILLTSSSYVFQGQSYSFPRRRLYQALSLPEVKSVAPFYQSEAQWLNKDGGVRRDVFVMAFKPSDQVFALDDIERQIPVLQRPDTVLVDKATLPMYGSQATGRLVEIGDRTMEIGGQYVLGVGFLGLGAVVTSDLNFIRIFPERTLGAINLGFVSLKTGSDSNEVASRLRKMLPADTKVLTRQEIETQEVSYWLTRTATGIIFGFGVIVSIIVGMVILYQTLATQVTRHLPEYATLKAIGYTDAYLRGVVVTLATMMVGFAFVPALASALMIYDKIRVVARLPIEMTGARVFAVLALVLAMAAASALVAVRILRRAEPADLF